MAAIQEIAMGRLRIPKNAGEFKIGVASAGNYIVWNNKSGKNKVLIPCRDKKQAESIWKQLNEKDHDGEIWF